MARDIQLNLSQREEKSKIFKSLDQSHKQR